MMQKLPQVSAKETIKRLEKAGLEIERITGSHYIMRSSDGSRYATVPYHGRKKLKKGTLKNILRGAKLSNEDFINLR